MAKGKAFKLSHSERHLCPCLLFFPLPQDKIGLPVTDLTLPSLTFVWRLTNSLLFLLSNLQMLEMQRTVSACSYAAFEHDKPGDAEEIRSPTELVVAVWPVHGLLSPVSVRQQELSVRLCEAAGG